MTAFLLSGALGFIVYQCLAWANVPRGKPSFDIGHINIKYTASAAVWARVLAPHYSCLDSRRYYPAKSTFSRFGCRLKERDRYSFGSFLGTIIRYLDKRGDR